MKYKVGMYGGSFDPLHIGHIHDIIKAAALCEELYVMLSWCEGRIHLERAAVSVDFKQHKSSAECENSVGGR